MVRRDAPLLLRLVEQPRYVVDLVVNDDANVAALGGTGVSAPDSAGYCSQICAPLPRGGILVRLFRWRRGFGPA